MPKPLVVSIPHHLGRQEAIRRLTEGIAYLKSKQSATFTVLQEGWTGDQLNFEVGALGQKAGGVVDVGDDQVTLSVTLPYLLALMAEKAKTLIQKEGTLLLEKK